MERVRISRCNSLPAHFGSREYRTKTYGAARSQRPAETFPPNSQPSKSFIYKHFCSFESRTESFERIQTIPKGQKDCLLVRRKERIVPFKRPKITVIFVRYLAKLKGIIVGHGILSECIGGSRILPSFFVPRQMHVGLVLVLALVLVLVQYWY